MFEIQMIPSMLVLCILGDDGMTAMEKNTHKIMVLKNIMIVPSHILFILAGDNLLAPQNMWI
jgi:hypothetical protein